MQILLYKICALDLYVSSLSAFVSVSWNHVVNLYDQTILDFPPNFPFKKDALINKHYTAMFSVGILTATVSLVSFLGVIMFLFQMSSLTPQDEVKDHCASKLSAQKT